MSDYMHRTVSEIKHRTVETNSIHMHIAESGAGPLVVLCRGFPNHGIRGAISCTLSQKLDSTRSRQICEATPRFCGPIAFAA
jgi:hypothetical protein